MIAGGSSSIHLPLCVSSRDAIREALLFSNAPASRHDSVPVETLCVKCLARAKSGVVGLAACMPRSPKKGRELSKRTSFGVWYTVCSSVRSGLSSVVSTANSVNVWRWKILRPGTTKSAAWVRALIEAGLIAVVMFSGCTQAQSGRQNALELAATLEPLRPGVTESALFSLVEEHNEVRKSALRHYMAVRTYQVIDLNGKVHAEEVGWMEFHAPDKKLFVVTSESRSGLIRRMALNPLISSEIETAAGRQHHDSAISSANYSLNLLGEQQVGPHRCFVAQAVPKRKDKYLFEGRLWTLETTPSSESKGILRRSYRSGSNALTLSGSTRRSRDSGFPKKIGRLFGYDFAARRF